MIPQHAKSFFFPVLLGLGAAACGSAGIPAKTVAAAPKTATPEERVQKIQRWMAREPAPAGFKQVALLDGLASGDLESQTAPKPECKKDQDGDTVCSFVADLGADEDGLPSTVDCSIATYVSTFGLIVKATLGKKGLDETPVIGTKQIGEGLVASFVANTTHEDADTTYVGTEKIAVLYARGYTASCVDERAGGRKTFDRVVDHFFKSLKFKENPKRPAVFALGYQMRVGDRVAGFRYESVHKRAGDDPGFYETNNYFWLETDGRTWSVQDGASFVTRGIDGGIETIRNLYWADGKGPAMLSAKPSEDKRFRLKYEVGDKSNGLESTPKAPLATELWAAPELAKLSAGGAHSFKYATLGLADSDPSFHYLTITRARSGVLLEEEEKLTAAGKKDTSGEAMSKDELHVDGQGLVTKEVSKRFVSELVYKWGELPARPNKRH